MELRNWNDDASCILTMLHTMFIWNRPNIIVTFYIEFSKLYIINMFLNVDFQAKFHTQFVGIFANHLHTKSVGTVIIYLHTKCNTPYCSDLLVTAVEIKDRQIFCTPPCFLHYTKKCSKKSCVLFKNTELYTTSRPQQLVL